MSTRWFFPSARLGAGASTVEPKLSTSVTFAVNGASRGALTGPQLTLVGPGDVLGFDRSMVLREEPPPGSEPAAQNVLASVELAHADLPWLLSQTQANRPLAGATPQPWIVLIVLADDEVAPPRPANPLPVLTVPLALLPPLGERWAWAHVEARLGDDVTNPETARQLTERGVREHSAGVVGRLICPRQLGPDRGWIAAIVPTTASGVAAGLGASPPGSATADAWPGDVDPVELPVYHWWTFRTGQAGTFEELARRLRFRPAENVGLGTRTIDVTRPWPDEPEGEEPAEVISVALDGALRLPGSASPEAWSGDGERQTSFRGELLRRLNAPAARREPTDGQEEDRDVGAVAPPLYGSHHTGQQTIQEDDSWLSTLNLEVRRRVAAALGACYVQGEQEFLMARAWEQAGEIRQANRLLAATELAAVATKQAQQKHLADLDATDLVTTLAPVADRIVLASRARTLTAELAATPGVLSATTSTPFARLTRRGGALARRAGRDIGPETAAPRSEALAQALTDMVGLSDDLREAIDPLRRHLRRMADRIPTESFAQRAETEARPLRPIMAHPTFDVAMAGELLTRWPEWAIPGIGGLPADSVTLLETNPEFVAALLVGLNHEFNRELLWREFPTDQRGTAFARFWPTEGADVDEIARWPLSAPLGSQLRGGDEASLALLVRGELLRRFPGTALLGVHGENGKLPTAFAGLPATPLALDESTVLYLFAGIDADQAVAEDWFFVFREPMRGTQFGFDSDDQPRRFDRDDQPRRMDSWADLTWSQVTVDPGSRYVRLDPPPPTPPGLPAGAPIWANDAADVARIAFQQPFQLAFRAAALLGRD